MISAALFLMRFWDKEPFWYAANEKDKATP